MHILQKEWFKFDDSTVSRASRRDVETTYGEASVSRYAPTANAYMLTYRHVDAARNMVHVEDVPEYVRVAMDAVEKREKEEKDPDNITIKVRRGGKLHMHTCITSHSSADSCITLHVIAAHPSHMDLCTCMTS